MRHAAVRRLAVLFVVGSLFFGLMPTLSASAVTNVRIRNAVEARINAARDHRDLRILRVPSARCPGALRNKNCMQVFAQNHAKKMAAARTLYHDTPFRLWQEVPVGAWWRAENVGYVSQGPNAARRVHKAFMKSSGHRANILKKRATHMGVGVYQTTSRCPGVSSPGCIWFVQRFADLLP